MEAEQQRRSTHAGQGHPSLSLAVDKLKQLLGNPNTNALKAPKMTRKVFVENGGIVATWNPTLSAISIYSLKQLSNPSSTQAMKQLACLPDIDFEAEGLEFNSIGEHLAIFSSKRCIIAHLPSRTRADIHFSGEKTVHVRGKDIGIFLESPKLKLIQATWHPFSPSHIFLLSSDNVLRLFNVEKGEEAEQIFELNLLTDHPNLPPAVSFALPSRALLWSAFSVFILMENGEIYVLCPVLPSGCIIENQTLDDLSNFVHSKIQSKSSGAKNIQLQAKWLSEIRGYALSSSISSSNQAEEKSRTTFVRTKHAQSFSRYSIRLQGPFMSSPPPSQKIVEAQELACISGEVPLVLGRLSSGTMIDFLLYFDQVSPSWFQEDPNEETGEELAEMMLYEEHQLVYDPKNISRNSWIVMDPSDQEKIFVVKGGSIEMITISWITKLQKWLLKADDEDAPPSGLPDLSPSVSNLILQPMSSIPSSNLIGATVVEETTSESLLVAVTAGGFCSSFDLNSQIYGFHRKKKNVSLPSSALTLPPPPPLPIIIPSPPSVLTPNEVLAFLKERTTTMREEYLKYLQKLYTSSSSRLEALNTVLSRQSQDVQGLTSVFVSIQGSSQQLTEKLQMVTDYQSLLRSRVDTLLDLLNSYQQTLSQEEIEYHSQLDDFSQNVQKYRLKIGELKDKVEKTKEKERERLQLGDQHLNNLPPLLKQLNSMITNLVGDISHLKTDVNLLSSP